MLTATMIVLTVIRSLSILAAPVAGLWAALSWTWEPAVLSVLCLLVYSLSTLVFTRLYLRWTGRNLWEI